MITIRQVERDEHYALHIIRKFIKRHTLFSYIVITLVIIVAISLFCIIMLLGAVGGNQLDIALQKQVCLGEITPGEYSMIMNSAITAYNIVSIGMNIIIAWVILFWMYIIFKEYLKYKRDNL